MGDIDQTLRDCTTFAERHLPTCAIELLEWSDTGVLRDGKIRELARMFSHIETVNALRVAENMVKHAALQAVVRRATEHTHD